MKNMTRDIHYTQILADIRKASREGHYRKILEDIESSTLLLTTDKQYLREKAVTQAVKQGI